MVYLKRSKRFLSKAQKTTPTLSPLQQSAHATSRILQKG